jgi:hypothetical protein
MIILQYRIEIDKSANHLLPDNYPFPRQLDDTLIDVNPALGDAVHS